MLMERSLAQGNTDDSFHGESSSGNCFDNSSLGKLVRMALDNTGLAWLKRIEVLTDGGTVILRGKVPSFYLKQMALFSIRSVTGLDMIRNEILVGNEM
jgi:osmotically-inducible protein OsmY